VKARKQLRQNAAVTDPEKQLLQNATVVEPETTAKLFGSYRANWIGYDRRQRRAYSRLSCAGYRGGGCYAKRT